MWHRLFSCKVISVKMFPLSGMSLNLFIFLLCFASTIDTQLKYFIHFLFRLALWRRNTSKFMVSGHVLKLGTKKAERLYSLLILLIMCQTCAFIFISALSFSFFYLLTFSPFYSKNPSSRPLQKPQLTVTFHSQIQAQNTITQTCNIPSLQFHPNSVFSIIQEIWL